MCLWIQILPGGCRREGADEPGGDISKQLHGLSGPHQCHPEPAGPTFTAVPVTGKTTITTVNKTAHFAQMFHNKSPPVKGGIVPFLECSSRYCFHKWKFDKESQSTREESVTLLGCCINGVSGMGMIMNCIYQDGRFA